MRKKLKLKKALELCAKEWEFISMQVRVRMYDLEIEELKTMFIDATYGKASMKRDIIANECFMCQYVKDNFKKKSSWNSGLNCHKCPMLRTWYAGLMNEEQEELLKEMDEPPCCIDSSPFQKAINANMATQKSFIAKQADVIAQGARKALGKL